MIHYFTITVTVKEKYRVTAQHPRGCTHPLYIAHSFAGIYDTGQYSPTVAAVKRTIKKTMVQRHDGWKDKKLYKVTYVQAVPLSRSWFELIYPKQLEKFEKRGRLGLNLYKE